MFFPHASPVNSRKPVFFVVLVLILSHTFDNGINILNSLYFVPALADSSFRGHSGYCRVLFDGLSIGRRWETSGLDTRSCIAPCVILGKPLYFSISDLIISYKTAAEKGETSSVPQRAAGMHRESLPNMLEKWKYFK